MKLLQLLDLSARRRCASALAALLVLGIPAVGAVSRDAAAASNRAVVVVDTGDNVYVRVVSFSSSSITGLDALRLAGADPVTLGYSGQGAAVCKLFGIGHEPTAKTCLGTPSDPRYWAYFRAPAGSTSYTYSSVGAGASVVHDKDVEGWKFGTGQPPPFYSFCETAGCASGGTAGSGGGGSSPPSSANSPGSSSSGEVVAIATGQQNAAGSQAGSAGGTGQSSHTASEMASEGGQLAVPGDAGRAGVALTETESPVSEVTASEASREDGGSDNKGARGLELSSPIWSAVAVGGTLAAMVTSAVVTRRRRRAGIASQH
mgnify:CR=1 FL=1